MHATYDHDAPRGHGRAQQLSARGRLADALARHVEVVVLGLALLLSLVPVL